MNTFETIELMKQHINAIQEYAAKQTEGQPQIIVDKVNEISNKTISVIETAIAKVEETANEVVQDKNYEAFLTKVEEKCTDACAYTIKKIDEMIINENYEQKLLEASRQVQEAFDSVTSNEEVKEVVSSVKELTASIHQQIDEYLAKPETQAIIKQAKKTALHFAEKSYDALKTLLEEDEENKEEE